jgi:sterol desaturase/sphingolipid hydroxylase (fatty acid hydroxylase superfamily)/rhodanese-related sulfurtransferase
MLGNRQLKLWAISAFLVVGFIALLAPRRASMEALLRKIDRDFPEVAQITSTKLAERLAAGDALGLFDVRTLEEYAAGHLPGATLLEEGTPSLAVVGRVKETTREAVLYCSVGYRAAQKAEELMEAGFTNVTVLRGSIFQWVNEGRAIEAAEGREPLVHPHSYTYVHLVPAEKRLELPGSTLLLNHFPRAERWRLAIGFGMLVLFLVWESMTPAFHWFNNPKARFAHGWRNYLLGFINVILVGLFFVQLWLLTTRWVARHDAGLLNMVELPGWVRIGIAVVLLDLWTYGWHWLNHQIGFLWRFHRAHHTEVSLDITSSVRFHFGEIVLSGLLRVPIILALGLSFKELLIYETLLFTVVQFQHANIRLPGGVERWLSLLMVSPGFHRVHHSQDERESNTNFSSLLSIWDRLFGTRAPKLMTDGGAAEFGVRGMKGPEQQTLVGMIETPLN